LVQVLMAQLFAFTDREGAFENKEQNLHA